MYVDDTFVLFADKSDVDDFSFQLSQLHPALKFTCETENNSQLPFLDVLVQRKDDCCWTTIYRKKTFTGEYVPWSSFCPVKRKTSIISCLVHRAIQICSAPLLDIEINKISDIFQNLGYPSDVVRHTIKSGLLKSKQPLLHGPKKAVVYVRLPYIGPTSDRYQQQLSKAEVLWCCYFKNNFQHQNFASFTSQGRDSYPEKQQRYL